MKSAAILALLSLGVAAENHIKETEDGRLTQAPRVNIEDWSLDRPIGERR